MAIFGAHQLRVAAKFKSGSTEELVALYHDHIEDDLGDVPKSVRLYVEILSRGVDESYMDYIRRIKDSGNEIAINVKIADLLDNLERCKGKYGGVKTGRLKARYERALGVLDPEALEGN